MNRKKINLPQETISELISIFSTFPEIEKVTIFGSRGLGNAKPGSDVDIAFSGKQLTPQIVSRIQNFLDEETLFPYYFDCIHLETIRNEALPNHIESNGITLYLKDPDR